MNVNIENFNLPNAVKVRLIANAIYIHRKLLREKIK